MTFEQRSDFSITHHVGGCWVSENCSTNCQHTEVQGSFIRIALNDSLLEKRACNGAQVKVLIASQARRLRMDLEREREEATHILMATQSL